MRAFAPRREETPAMVAAASGRPVPAKATTCVFADRGAAATPRYERSKLPTGAVVSGPAIVEDAFSTVVAPPGSSVVADAYGHLHIDVGATP